MQGTNDFWQFFVGLRGVRDGTLLHCKRIGQAEVGYLTRDRVGFPLFLLKDDSGIRKPSLVLEHVRVEYGLQCQVADDRSTFDGVFTGITCASDDAGLQELFVKSFSDLLGTAIETISGRDIDNYVRSLVELFRGLSRPNLRSIKGLWGELLLISMSSNPEVLLNAWRLDTQDAYDFSGTGMHIEVKCSEGDGRVHDFSLRQIRPSDSSVVYIASFMLMSSASGVTIAELAERISTRVSALSDVRAKLWGNVFSTLGANYREADEYRFSEDYAKSHLLLARAEGMPWYSESLPKGILNVHAKIDMASVDEASVVNWSFLEELLK